MLSITLRQLDYAVAVARHGGITAAAQALHVSQPALSVALKELEARLGQPLFLRRPGGAVAPTAFGRGWLAEAERQLAAIARLADPQALANPPLRLAVFHDLAATCLAPLMVLATQHGLRIEPQTMGFEPLSSALKDGRADAALTWDLGLPGGIDRQVMARIPPHAVLAPGHPLAARAALTLKCLDDQQVILTDQGPSIAHLRALFAQAGIAPGITRAASLEVMRSEAANGLGVGLSYTNPAGRLSPDGRPFVTRRIADAGAEPVVLAMPQGAGLPGDGALAALVTQVLSGPAFPDLIPA